MIVGPLSDMHGMCMVLEKVQLYTNVSWASVLAHAWRGIAIGRTRRNGSRPWMPTGHGSPKFHLPDTTGVSRWDGWEGGPPCGAML